jgi:hypothetical protein
MIVLDGAVYQFTANALELGPAGGGGLDAAGVRAAIGMAAADLDDQLDAINLLGTDIKVKTDQLVFTVANQLNVNVRSVNSVGVQGNGQVGTEWRPV